MVRLSSRCTRQVYPVRACAKATLTTLMHLEWLNVSGEHGCTSIACHNGRASSIDHGDTAGAAAHREHRAVERRRSSAFSGSLAYDSTLADKRRFARVYRGTVEVGVYNVHVVFQCAGWNHFGGRDGCNRACTQRSWQYDKVCALQPEQP